MKLVSLTVAALALAAAGAMPAAALAQTQGVSKTEILPKPPAGGFFWARIIRCHDNKQRMVERRIHRP